MTDTPHSPLGFMKMHGAGNDFVVIDRRAGGPVISPALARAIADRHRGVGFDQLATIDPDPEAGASLTFFNADGSVSAACGNATRCIANHLMGQSDTDTLSLRTDRGLLQAKRSSSGAVSVNMGAPSLNWADIPLARDLDSLHLPIEGDPVATGMGNPHCTFFVDDAEAVDLVQRGPEIEHHPLFPERTNVQFAHVIGPDHLRMRVWERGTGITLASGSSSCAVAVAAHRRGLTGRTVTLDLDGGQLHIDWQEDGVWMTGPTAHVFTGTFSADWLAAVE